MRRVLSVLVCLFPLSLFAQEAPASEPGSQPAPTATNTPTALSAAPTEAPAPSDKKPIISFAASAGATVLGSTLVILSVDSFIDVNVDQGRALGLLGLATLTAGPSAGHFYAGDLKHAAIFSGTRLALAGIFFAGFSAAKNGALEADAVKNVTGGALMAISGVGIVSFALYDVADSPFSVKRDKESIFSFRVAPSPIANVGQGITPGMTLRASF